MLKVAVANQKGGTGKTTTVLMLSYLLSRRGYDVLAIDLDPQASLTLALGFDPDEVVGSVTDVISEYVTLYGKRYEERKADVTLKDVAKKVKLIDAEFDLVPATPFLESYNFQLGAVVGGENVVKNALNDVNGYDVVLIDTQPTLGKVTINALVAADRVLAPVELSYMSLGGLTLLINTVLNVRDTYNSGLSWLGILPVKYEKKNNVVKKNAEKLEKVKDYVKVYSPVPKSVALERLLIERIPIEELSRKLRSAREVLSAYESVVEDVVKLAGERRGS